MSTKNLSLAITTLLNLTAAAARVSAVVAKAHAEGRSGPSDEELAAITAEDDAARAELVAAIAAAKA